MAGHTRLEPLETDRATSGGTLLAWAERSGRRVAKPRGGGVRFVFYGRAPTEDRQDPVTSRSRQWGQAAALARGHGQIVAEFFDVGQSRVLPWARRLEAAALVAAMADPDLLAHLPALYILLAEPDLAYGTPSAEDVIGHLRKEKITLTYDPQTRALQVDAREGVKIIIDDAR